MKAIVGLGIVAMALVVQARAQTPATGGAAIRCDAFKRIENGTWVTVKTVELKEGGMTIEMPPGVLIFPHFTNVDGVDLVQFLDTKCKQN